MRSCPSPSMEGAESEKKGRGGSATEPERVCITVSAAVSGSNEAGEEEEEEGEEEGHVDDELDAASCARIDLWAFRRFSLFPRRDSDTARVATSIIPSPFTSSSSTSDSEDEEEEDPEEASLRETAAAAAKRLSFAFADFFAAFAAAFAAAFSAAFRASGPPEATKSRSLASAAAAMGDSAAGEGTAEAGAEETATLRSGRLPSVCRLAAAMGI